MTCYFSVGTGGACKFQSAVQCWFELQQHDHILKWTYKLWFDGSTFVYYTIGAYKFKTTHNFLDSAVYQDGIFERVIFQTFLKPTFEHWLWSRMVWSCKVGVILRLSSWIRLDWWHLGNLCFNPGQMVQWPTLVSLCPSPAREKMRIKTQNLWSQHHLRLYHALQLDSGKLMHKKLWQK